MPGPEPLPLLEWPQSSTHYRNWLLGSSDALRRAQAQTHAAAARKLKARHPGAQIPPLDDELWLIKYYSYQLSRFLSTNNLKATVKETSLSFFNRFYLRRSPLEYDPRIVMFTCITLATKLEDMWKSVYVDKLLGSVQELDIAKVFEMECIVCDALSFNLLVLHTSDSAYAVVQLLIEYLRESLELEDSKLSEHLKIIVNILKQAEENSVNMHESPEFLFVHTPAQLALANVVYHVKSALSPVLSIDTFILRKLLNDDDRHLLGLLNTLYRITDEYEEFLRFRNDFNLPESKERARSILDLYLAVYELEGSG